MHAQSGGDPWSGGSKMGQCKVLLERVSNLIYKYDILVLISS
jgi:tRNA ligase